jgi:hypothetical protein
MESYCHIAHSCMRTLILSSVPVERTRASFHQQNEVHFIEVKGKYVSYLCLCGRKEYKLFSHLLKIRNCCSLEIYLMKWKLLVQNKWSVALLLEKFGLATMYFKRIAPSKYLSTKFGSTALVNTRIFIITLTLSCWTIRMLHCRVLGSVPWWHSICVSQLQPFLYGRIGIYPFSFNFFSFFVTFCMENQIFCNLNQQSWWLQWELNSGARRLKKFPFFAFMHRFSVAVFY